MKIGYLKYNLYEEEEDYPPELLTEKEAYKYEHYKLVRIVYCEVPEDED